MASTSPTRIDDELYESAKAIGRHMDRSASQQLAHWARIGRELEAGASVSMRAVADVLAGAGDYDGLSAEEQAVVRTEWSERVAARLATLDLAAAFAAEGRSYVELDDSGTVARRTPHAGRGASGRDRAVKAPAPKPSAGKPPARSTRNLPSGQQPARREADRRR